jgi:uncharacterized membrane protein
MKKSSHEVQIRGQQTPNTRTVEGRFYQGVIPSPEMMYDYQQIDPDLPKNIFRLTEEEAIHRRSVEKKIINHSFASLVVGNLCGLLAILAIGVLAYLFMINGHSEDGRWIAVSIAGVVGIFVIRKYITSKNDKPKGGKQ